MNTDFEGGLQQLGEVFNKHLAKIGAVPRYAFFEGMIQVFRWNFRDVDGISAKVEEVVRYQGKAVGPIIFRFGVDSVAEMGLAILVQQDCFIDPHGVNQLAMSGTLTEIDPASPGNPVADFGQFDNVPLAYTVFAFCQRAKVPERVWSILVIVVNDVGEEFGHRADFI